MKVVLLTALMLLSAMPWAYAQTGAPTPSNAYKKKAIEEILREKIRKPIATYPLDDMAKTTAGQDQKVTNTSSSSTQEAEVSLAYHPADSNKVVLSFMNQTPTGQLTFPIYYSSNGGQSWTKSIFNPASITAADFPGYFMAGGGDPTFAWDKNGRLYFSWIYLPIKQTFDTAYFVLNWAYSDNNGQTWTTAPGKDHFIGHGMLDVTTSAVLDSADGICDRQWLAVDNSGGPNQGTLYCSFVLFPPDNSALPTGEYVKVKDFGSNTFGPVRLAYSGSSQFGNVEVAPNGTLHLTCGDIDQDQIIHVSSTNKGQSFSSPHIVGAGLGLMGAGDTQPPLVHDRENGVPNLAIDGAGNLHCVWTSLDYNGNTFDAYYARSTNAGATWSARMPLSGKLAGRRGFMPTVAAFGNKVSISTAGIATNDSSTMYDIYSADNGLTWQTPVQLSTAQSNYKSYTGTFFGDYNRSQRTQCITYAAWTDGRNAAGPKVYFSRVNSCALSIKTTSTVNGAFQLTQAYPNPASTQVNLQIAAAQKGMLQANLIDLQGKILRSKSYHYSQGNTTISLDLQGLASGTYMLQLTAQDGTLVSTPIAIQP